MKKIALSVLILAGFVLSATAQDTASRSKMHGGHHYGMMSEKLNFSDDQKAQMKTINEDYRKQMDALKKTDEIAVKEWRSRMETLRNDHKERIKELLTADQKTQLEKMKAERKQKMETRSAERINKMKAKLGLTDDQVTALNQNRQDLRDKLKAIHDNASLDKNKKNEEMKEAMKQQKEKMRTILTEEQLKKMKEGSKEKNKMKEPI